MSQYTSEERRMLYEFRCLLEWQWNNKRIGAAAALAEKTICNRFEPMEEADRAAFLEFMTIEAQKILDGDDMDEFFSGEVTSAQIDRLLLRRVFSKIDRSVSQGDEDRLQNVPAWNQAVLQASSAFCGICVVAERTIEDCEMDAYDLTADIGIQLRSQDGTVFAAIFLSPDEAIALAGEISGMAKDIKKRQDGVDPFRSAADRLTRRANGLRAVSSKK
jgi:hypothetical protein